MNKELRILFGAILIISLFSFSHNSLAYAPTTTHAGLSEQIVEFYNLNFSRKIDNSQKELIIQGSINEDDPATRALNHFYDPIRNIGINDGRTAKEWATDGKIVANIYSWPKIIQYYAQGDEQKAYLGLGHIIHLIEDMAVPDHTRNDPHIGVGLFGLYTNPSPFEDWADQNKNRSTLQELAKQYFQSGERPKILSGLADFFDFLANYSNKNFFSKDTIVNPIYQYPEPKIIEFDENYGYGIDSLSGEKNKLLIAIKKKGERELMLETKDDKLVLQEYFSRLSKQAIFSGAGVVDLFFKEAEVAKQEYLKQQQIQQQQTLISFITKSYQTIKNNFHNGVIAVYQGASNVGSMAVFTSKTLANLTGIFVDENKDLLTVGFVRLAPNVVSGPQTFVQNTVPKPEPKPVEIPTEIVSLQLVSAAPIVVSEPPKSEIPSPKVVEPVKPVEEIPWWKQMGFNSPGELPGQAVVPEPSAEPTPPPPPLDTTPPSVSLAINNYNLMARSLDLEWESPDSDVDFYNLEFQKINGEWQELEYETQETNLNFSADDFSTYKFRIQAVDLTSNESEWIETESSFEISTRPVVINEIAWMGTIANPADEWIELYNNTNSDIDLAGWSLVAPDDSPNIHLTGVIKAKSYFLLERTDDQPTSETADMFFTGALNNNNPTGLTLKNGENIIDQVSLWYAGKNIFGLSKLSMERISPNRAGDDINNWKNNDMITFNGMHIGGNVIYGTPKKQNSRANVIGGSYSRNMIFYPYSEVVYLIDNFTLNSGYTLTIEPGAVIKMGHSYGIEYGLMTINGDIIANGLPDKKIYITSEKDDRWDGTRKAYGGADPAPAIGDWHSIHLIGSQNSVFKNVEISYGGRNQGGGCCDLFVPYSSVLIENSSLTLENVSIHKSWNSAIRLKGISFLKMINSEIKNTIGDGIVFEAASPSGGEIRNNIFENNRVGIKDEGRGLASRMLQIIGNSFIKTPVPINYAYINAPFENYNNTSDSGFISLSGLINNNGERILKKDGLDYVVEFLIVDGGVLKIEPGVVLKFSSKDGVGILVKNGGSLQAIGTADHKIYFTSSQDNPQPGDWRGIQFVNAGDSEITQVVIKYGGNLASGCCWFTFYYAGVLIDGENNKSSGVITISHSEIDSNLFAGIIVKNHGNLSISNSVIKNHQLLPVILSPELNGGYGIRSEGENEIDIDASVEFLNNVVDK